MSLQESIERLRALDDQHPDWGNTLDDCDPQMIADIVAVVRDRIRQHDNEESWDDYYKRLRDSKQS